MMKLNHYKFLLKEWRSKETKLMLSALIVAVAMLAMLGFYVDRVQRTTELKTAEFLGGDLALNSSTPLLPKWQQKSSCKNCHFAQTLVFPTMLSSSSGLHLATIKAVSTAYPLYGKLLVTDNHQEQILYSGPLAGSVWLAPELAKLLKINLNDSVKIGTAHFKVTRLIISEPDAGALNVTIAPRVLMSIADIAKTQILTPGSRIDYYLLIKGDSAQISNYSQWLAPQLSANQKLITPREASNQLTNTLEKAEAFLKIMVLANLILAGIAIAITSRYFMSRQISSVALLRCLGLTYRHIVSLYSLHFLCLGLCACMIGCSIGYFAQLILAKSLAQWLSLDLLAASLWPAFFSSFFGLVMLFGFSLPLLVKLKRVSPMLVLRKFDAPINNSTIFLYSIIFCIIFASLCWLFQDSSLLGLVISGFGITAASLYCAAWLLIKLLKPLRNRVGISWRYGLANLNRRMNSSILQIIVFGFIYMVLLLIILIKTDLFTSWQQQIPPNSPTIFAINIQPLEVTDFQTILKKLVLRAETIYPIVKGRLVRLNNKPILEAIPPEARDASALKRELNLTWSQALPPTNQIVAGNSWKSFQAGKALVSMDVDLAKKFGIKPNDKLSFQINNQLITATVHSLRKIQWYSLQPNFFIIFPDKVINNFPATYMTSFYLDKQHEDTLITINQQFPSITLIDVKAVLTKIKEAIAQISITAYYILGFSIVASYLVLLAALLNSHDERIYESAVLRCLGAHRRQIMLSLLTEYLTLGFFAGLLASLGANLTAAAFAQYFLKITPQFNFWSLLVTPVIGAVVLALAGLSNNYKVVNTASAEIMREIY